MFAYFQVALELDILVPCVDRYDTKQVIFVNKLALWFGDIW